MGVFGGYGGSYFGGYFGSVGGSAPLVLVATGPCPSVLAALDRLCEQFRGKPNIAALLMTLAEPACSLEDALQALLTQRTLDTATGAQLDRLGVITGQPRNGLGDDTYRRYLRARITVNRSGGVVEDLLSISRQVLDDPDVHVRAEDQGIAALEVYLEDAEPPTGAADVLISFLRVAVAAGVRVLLRALTDTPDNSFTTARAAFAAAPIGTSDTTVTVDSTAGFPDVGSLDIDPGLATAETVTYTARLATQFLGVSHPASAHLVGAAVQQSGAPGKGWGDSSDATVGGAIATVLE